MVSDEFQVGKTTVLLIRGDITEVSADAIVNAANSSLMGGGGVDGAIHRKAGPKILEESKKIRTFLWPNGLPTGEAVITSAGKLKAKHIIHTVGPVWRGGNRGEAELLAKAYLNSLKLAVDYRLTSIAFPSVSTGAYGYPFKKASVVALETTKNFLEKDNSLQEVIFVQFSKSEYEKFKETAKQIF